MNIQLKLTRPRRLSADLGCELPDSLVHTVEGILLAENLRKLHAAAGGDSLAAQRNAQRIEVQTVLHAVCLDLLKERVVDIFGGEILNTLDNGNEPWKVLEYCATLGEIYDIVVEDMDRQSRGLKG